MDESSVRDQDRDKVIAYSTPTRNPRYSVANTFGGIFLVAISAIVAFSIGGVIAIVVAVTSHAPLIALFAFYLVAAIGMGIPSRIAWKSREVNRGATLGIYIGVGMCLLVLGLFALRVIGLL